MEMAWVGSDDEKDRSCVIRNFGTRSPLLSRVHCFARPRGVTTGDGNSVTVEAGKGTENPWVTSFEISVLTCSISSVADLWFPRAIEAVNSIRLSSAVSLRENMYGIPW
jgi:hypothetical protein